MIDPYITIYRENGRIHRCLVEDGNQSVELPLTGVEFDQQAHTPGDVKLGVLAMRVRFKDSVDNDRI